MIVQHRDFTLVFHCKLLEKLESGGEVFDESVLHFVGLRLLSNLKKCLLEISDWA